MQYKQLTKEERYYIECRKANNIHIGVRDLAREMDRSPSTISRECTISSILIKSINVIITFYKYYNNVN